LTETKVKDIYVNPDERRMVVEKMKKEGIRKDCISYCKKKNGERFISEMTCALLRDESGKAVRVEGIFRTRTEK